MSGCCGDVGASPPSRSTGRAPIPIDGPTDLTLFKGRQLPWASPRKPSSTISHAAGSRDTSSPRDSRGKSSSHMTRSTRCGRGSHATDDQARRYHDNFGDPTIADAVLDRLVHNAYRIDLNGESLRKQRSMPPPTSSPA
ncbi:hypothetical protein C9427_33300 [Mesorhizobium helmanticense]|uniref:IstB-like ATP-binding domain-containing protein n=1 Tax=Mesorhizobium helmanticense TaxID=1776423 RepID=A0A2T4IKK6_9HYPH|nr:hypothetical protein C9427_33300 [Mesorhizobium helmanticense]